MAGILNLSLRLKTKAGVSNGYVRMLNAHVQQLYDHVEVGMAVEIMR